MSYDCCKALRGWCRSFTKTERWLTVIAAIFLVVFISILTFLILHLLACSCGVSYDIHDITTSTVPTNSVEHSIYINKLGTAPSEPFWKNTTDGRSCSWTPSFKTEAVTRYYLDGRGELQTPPFKKQPPSSRNFPHLLLNDTPDEVDLDTVATGLVLALVRARPLAFGCIVSVVSARWSVTSASCVDSIEVLGHRERYVMVGHQVDVSDGYNVSEVKMHPKYRSNSTSYDLCALKSVTAFRMERTLRLPTPIDALITVLGSRLTAFGYRRNRSGGALRAAAVRTLSARRCPLGGAVGGVCAGRRGGACGAGSPLLRGRTLLAVRAGRGAGDCAPATYRSLAPHAHWLRSLDLALNYLF